MKTKLRSPRSGTTKATSITKRKAAAGTRPGKKDMAASYDQFKLHAGKQYTGVQVGRGHKWYYDKGEWKDTKITPDLWRISYAVTKRRAGKAPKGSGAKTGTAYHWYIVAHQRVQKLNANDYSTVLTGLKYKIAHKRADKGKWSAKTTTQRNHLIRFLKDWLHQLENAVVPLQFEYNGETFKGEAVPVPESCQDGVCSVLEITLNEEFLGIIRAGKAGWKIDRAEDQKFVDAIAQQIQLHYQ